MILVSNSGKTASKTHWHRTNMCKNNFLRKFFSTKSTKINSRENFPEKNPAKPRKLMPAEINDNKVVSYRLVAYKK